MPGKKLPSTIRRSPKKAQDTYSETLKSAVKEYGDGERAHRTALASLKHSFEKVGDHWEKKFQKGPSDKKAAGGRSTKAKSAEGVDANASKDHLVKVAKRLGIKGRTTMKKPQLVTAIKKANRTTSAKSLRKK
ncbi:ChaB family protein [Naasia lichenicola]|uniref:Cation transport regulator ChaB n=1 Tax=Naasia lichenicola TaxID=2565933 RepID=A0A4S4FST0_9MICO|nr:ChaB family protein [Naasia lichenicola]THG33368.1 cation transport regulator ChaB [Naasia lichenicola]